MNRTLSTIYKKDVKSFTSYLRSFKFQLEKTNTYKIQNKDSWISKVSLHDYQIRNYYKHSSISKLLERPKKSSLSDRQFYRNKKSSFLLNLLNPDDKTILKRSLKTLQIGKKKGRKYIFYMQEDLLSFYWSILKVSSAF